MLTLTRTQSLTLTLSSTLIFSRRYSLLEPGRHYLPVAKNLSNLGDYAPFIFTFFTLLTRMYRRSSEQPPLSSRL